MPVHIVNAGLVFQLLTVWFKCPCYWLESVGNPVQVRRCGRADGQESNWKGRELIMD